MSGDRLIWARLYAEWLDVGGDGCGSSAYQLPVSPSSSFICMRMYTLAAFSSSRLSMLV